MTIATKARPKDKPTKRANIVESMDGIFKAVVSRRYLVRLEVRPEGDGCVADDRRRDRIFQIDRGWSRTTDTAGSPT